MTCEEMAVYAANKALRRLGIEEESSKVLLDGELVEESLELSKKIDFEAGKSYKVKLDNVEYTTLGGLIPQTGFVFIGNPSIADSDMDDTGEPFFCYSYDDEDGQGTAFVAINGATHVTISTPETITPISDKYLPGVCLPVVEITSAEYSMENAVELSAKESAQFTAAAEASLPVVVKFTLGSLPISVLAQFVGGAYIANMGDGMFNFGPSESGWAMGPAVD